MSRQNPNIEFDQIAAYLSGEGTKTERKQVEDWISTSEENRLHFEKCRAVFELDYAIETETTEEQKFDTGSAWKNVYSRLDLSEKPLEDTQIFLDIQDDEVDDTPEITLEGKGRTYPWVRIAAVFVIVLTAVFLILNRSSDKPTTLTASALTEEFMLADSSRVVLESGASITYRDNFGKSNRELTLEGKAYFDVTRDEDLAFLIKTASGEVEVLGTSFEVQENNDSLYVVVENGIVRMTSLTTGEFVTLQRNERGVLNLRTQQITTTALANVNDLFWATNRLTYRQQSLISVFNELSEIFNKEIQYDPETINECRITAVFMDQSFNDILKNMALSMDFEYETDGDRVIITSNGCEPN
jgi:ferric-dicitrate binding protein FerR (iron transport regulator)